MRVDFAFNAPDRIAQAVDTTVKQVSRGVHLLVYCPERQRAEQYDQLLWHTDGTNFIAHDWLTTTALPNLPVYLLDEEGWSMAPPALFESRWLLNLHDECPPLPTGSSRILEIVSTDPAERQLARLRWRYYEQAGHTLHAHEISSR